MAHTEKHLEILGDLFHINKDCSAAYHRIIENNAPKSGLRTLLFQLVDVQRNCLLEIRRQVDPSFGDPAGAPDSKGDIYREWQMKSDTKVPAKEKDIYAFCERRLKAVNNAYDNALAQGAGLSAQVIHLLSKHIEIVKGSYDSIQRQRNGQPVGAVHDLVFG